MASRWGIDLDGCCYDFGHSFREYLIQNLGYTQEQLPDHSTWDFFNEWGMTKKEFYKHFGDGIDAGVIFLLGDPHDDCIETLKKIRKQEDTINIVTHRGKPGKRSIHNTADWLEREGVPYDNLTFAADKTIVKNDVFIEDNADNFMALREAGVGAFLINRPWNKHIETPYRVYSWAEFFDRANFHLSMTKERREVPA